MDQKEEKKKTTYDWSSVPYLVIPILQSVQNKLDVDLYLRHTANDCLI